MAGPRWLFSTPRSTTSPAPAAMESVWRTNMPSITSRRSGVRLGSPGKLATARRLLRYGENPHRGRDVQRSSAWPRDSRRPNSMHAKRHVLQKLHRRGRGLAGPPSTTKRTEWPSSTRTRAGCIAICRCRSQTRTQAHECDPLSAYGGVIAANTEGQRGDGGIREHIVTEVIGSRLRAGASM